MIKHLGMFIRGIQGIPFGERIMPMYIFANKDELGTTNIKYTIEQRGEGWWYRREVRITHPRQTDESHWQWFGPYGSEQICQERIKLVGKFDNEFSN